jgi:hypothetical protein
VSNRLTTNSRQLIERIPYVAGDVAGIQRPSERLAAAIENVMLAPH